MKIFSSSGATLPDGGSLSRELERFLACWHPGGCRRLAEISPGPERGHKPGFFSRFGRAGRERIPASFRFGGRGRAKKGRNGRFWGKSDHRVILLPHPQRFQGHQLHHLLPVLRQPQVHPVLCDQPDFGRVDTGPVSNRRSWQRRRGRAHRSIAHGRATILSHRGAFALRINPGTKDS
jgi:hypothetical protein